MPDEEEEFSVVVNPDGSKTGFAMISVQAVTDAADGIMGFLKEQNGAKPRPTREQLIAIGLILRQELSASEGDRVVQICSTFERWNSWILPGEPHKLKEALDYAEKCVFHFDRVEVSPSGEKN